MKRIAAILLALILSVMPAMALEGEGYPVYDGVLKQNSLGGQFGGDNLLLEFDPAGEYSYMRDGYIQGCFFTFDAAEEYYLELYLLLPEKLQAGDVLTPESCYAAGAHSSSITLFEVDEDNNEDAWFAGQLLGNAYPQNSGFSISITEAKYSETGVYVSGSIDGALCRLEGERPSGETMTVKLDFSFELPLGSQPQPQPTPMPKAGQKAPAFTLPPDHISL